MPSLDAFTQELRDYQSDCVAHALNLAETPGSRHLFSAPTGTGKGTIELALLREFRRRDVDALILTPSLDIARGFLERCGVEPDALAAAGDARLESLAEQIHVMTPVRYRNKILKGERESAQVFIADESHHYTEQVDTFSLLFALAPEATWLGFTATAFRGTPQGTKELHATWGEPWVILDVPQAVERGCCQLPLMHVVPLVDDDCITVKNGQFVTDSVAREVTGGTNSGHSRLVELLQLATREVRGYGESKPVPGVPTCLVLPSTEVGRLAEQLAGKEVEDTIPCDFIGQHSSAKDRAAAFKRCQERRSVLVVLNILGEGVDLPWLRGMVDAAPTLSPVVWAQRVGRIMRPGSIPPRYLCVCRNLERHAYLMQGAIPASYVAQAQQAFEKPSERAITRAFGMESLRKFKATPIPCRNGVTAQMWVVYSVEPDTGKTTQYAGIAHPSRSEILYAKRVNLRKDTSETDWGKWSKIEQLPPDLVGFSSVPFKNRISDRQREWWEDPHYGARKYGLDPESAASLTSRQFFCLPILADTRESL